MSEKVILINVKGHSGCFLNEMANERAETSLLSIYHGPSKYVSLQFRFKSASSALIVQVLEIEICKTGNNRPFL